VLTAEISKLEAASEFPGMDPRTVVGAEALGYREMLPRAELSEFGPQGVANGPPLA